MLFRVWNTLYYYFYYSFPYIYFLVYSINKMELSITVLSFIYFFTFGFNVQDGWKKKVEGVRIEKSIDVWIGKLLKYLKHSTSSSFKLRHRLELNWVGPLVSLLLMLLLKSFFFFCSWVLNVIMDFFLIINLKRVVDTLLFDAPFCIFCLINKWFESHVFQWCIDVGKVIWPMLLNGWSVKTQKHEIWCTKVGNFFPHVLTFGLVEWSKQNALWLWLCEH